MSKIISLNCPENVKNSVKDEGFRVFAASFTDEVSIILAKAKNDVEIPLMGVIGDEFSQCDAASISSILRANRGKPVTMRVNSPGGLAFDGLAIHNALAAHDGPTVGIIESLAASAASLAVLGCDTVKMYANATYHIHEGLSFAFGHIADLQDSIEWLQQFNLAAIATYSAKTGKSEKEMASALLGDKGDGTKYSAEQAKSAGFVDEIIPIGKTKPKPKNEDVQKLQAMLSYRIAKHRLTKVG
jgi:ATP-dependent protease ClpP protease subunit